MKTAQWASLINRRAAGRNVPHGTVRQIAGVMVFLAGWISAATFAQDARLTADGSRKPRVPILKVEQFTLKNGLTVILHENHKTPLVAINVIYNAGSKDDLPGRTGVAHLYEHLMFKGSLHNDQEFTNLIHEYAVETNATTGRDQTVYFNTITSNVLERTLWLEADRMGYLLPALTQENLDIERNVVKNERRSTHDNVPFGQAEERLLAELYRPGHPYRHLTIGSMADLSAVQLSDIRAFFERHYVPNNAFLCVAGDFQVDQVKRWIEQYFGPLHRGPESSRPKPDIPHLTGPRHITMTDQVGSARTQLLWPTVAAGHPDEEPLDMLAAVLGGLANESRIFRRLIYNQSLAVDAGASHPTSTVSGEFRCYVYAQPGQKLSDLVRIVDEEIERLKKEGPSDVELRRAGIQREASLLLDLESVSGQASVLCQWAASRHDPMAYRGVMEKVFAVTREDVARVARQYLTADRIELDVVPGPKVLPQQDIVMRRKLPPRMPAPPLPPTRDPFSDDIELDVAPGAKALPQKDPDRHLKGPVRPPARLDDPFVDRDEFAAPTIGPPPRFIAPAFKRHKLSNGLTLRIVERHDVPLVTLSLVIRSGETSTPLGKEGLCAMTATLLDEGTTSRSALEIAGALSEMGASISTSGFLESMEINLTTLSLYLDAALDIYADVILNPAFADRDVERLKLERLAALVSGFNNAETIAANVIQKLLYPREHSYGRPEVGTSQSIKSMTRDDVVRYYRKTFVPGNAELVIVGDVNPQKLVAGMEKRLGSWPAGPLPLHPQVKAHAPSANQPLFLIDLPRATQSVITIGGIGLSGDSEQYHALSMVVSVASGRIEDEIRQAKGYSYSFSDDHLFRKGPGPFSWTGPVQTSATKDSLVDIIKEIVDVTGPNAATGDEIAQMEASAATTAFHRFETTAGVAHQIGFLVAYNLGDDYYATRIGPKSRVTKDELTRIAEQYFKPELMTILVVGDRSKIETPLKSIPFVKSISLLDREGNPVPGPAAGKSATSANGHSG